MSDEHAPGSQTSSDGTGRWLVGGLVGGGIILGLLIAAYAVGYHRGEQRGGAATSAVTTTGTTTTTAAETPTPPTELGPVTATPALVARGETLYRTNGCVACHSLTGAAGAGSSFKGLAGSTVKLSSGETVTADDAYLARSIADPDAQVVEGYRAGIMSAAIAGYGLDDKPDDLRALIAFIKSRR